MVGERRLDEAARTALMAQLGLDQPLHPYTQALLSAAPALQAQGRGQRVPLRGEMPSPLAPPPGCAFHARCPLAMARCRGEAPAQREVGGRRVACHRVGG
ncbi:MAG: hypothetical protein C0505_00105 [Leptothrix sp. (in: Bacteria)]|nr:hypothetical protein [Leptothrix sp. (in: b-proteobacteria)]